MTPTGPEQHDCADCGKPIRNAPRVAVEGIGGRVIICVPCHQVLPERKAFEDWWQSRGSFKPSRSSEPNYTHEYENPLAEMAWKAWRYRAALTSALTPDTGKSKAP